MFTSQRPPPASFHPELNPIRQPGHVGPQPSHLALSPDPSSFPHGCSLCQLHCERLLISRPQKASSSLTKRGRTMERALRQGVGGWWGGGLCVCSCVSILTKYVCKARIREILNNCKYKLSWYKQVKLSGVSFVRQLRSSGTDSDWQNSPLLVYRKLISAIRGR